MADADIILARIVKAIKQKMNILLSLTRYYRLKLQSEGRMALIGYLGKHLHTNWAAIRI